MIIRIKEKTYTNLIEQLKEKDKRILELEALLESIVYVINAVGVKINLEDIENIIEE